MSPDAVRARPRLHSLAVELTSACNQKCTYCYNAWREDDGRGVGALPTSDLVALLGRALDEIAFDHVTFTGGEPFSRRDLFEILDVCVARGTPLQIISNGGLITEAAAAALAARRPLSVQVTLDGPRADVHDAHVGGAGHFERTLRGIRLLGANGVRVVGCVVVTRNNAAQVGSILDLFASLGVTSISFSRFSPAGYAVRHAAALLPSRSDIVVALAQAEERAVRHGLVVSSTMPIPPCVVEHADYPHVRFGACPIGTEMQELVLGPRGELRNCTLHEEAIGDARGASFGELAASGQVQRYRDVTPEFCAPCVHAPTCLGGCGASAIAMTGARGLDPFVAQHVDDAFAGRLRAERAGLVSADRLVRP